MADVVRDILIKLGFDSGDVDRGVNLLSGSFTELDSVLNLLQKGFNYAQQAFQAFEATIERGQAFHELATAFNNLYGSADKLGNNGLAQLRAAVQGTISDLDLLREANIAAQAGLRPETFLKLAQSAEQLGDVIGQGPLETLSQLNQALITGNERMLKRIGIDVDAAQAEKEYARALGVNAEHLDELAKKEAFRAAVTKEVAEKAKAAGETTRTASDELTKLKVTIDNLLTSLANILNTASPVITVLEKIGQAAKAASEGFRFWATGYVNMGDKDFYGGPELKRLVEISNTLERFDLYHGRLRPSAYLPKWLFDKDALLAEQKELRAKLAARMLAEEEKERIRRAEEQERERIRQIEERERERTRIAQEQDRALSAQRLKNAESEAQKRFDINQKYFQMYADRIAAYLEAGTSEGLFAGLEKAFDNPEISEDITDFVEELNDKWQESADFFSDALYNAMTGAAFDAKDIMLRILAGVAGGFLAELTGGFGAGFGSLQGIGQVIGASLAGGGLAAGSGSLLSIFGLGGASALGPSATTAAGATAAGGGLSGLSSLGLGGFGALAAVAATGLIGAQGLQNVLSGKKLSDLQRFGLALPTFGASLLVNPVMSLFDDEGHPERLAREELLKKLRERMGGSLQFTGVRGPLTLDSRMFNVDFSQKGMGDIVGLVNPLAQVLTGGDDKLGSDLAGIFANAVAEARNFNEVIINTQSLLSSLGTDANQLKNEMTALFLDGKLSLEEFSAGIANLNVLAQDNLVGQGSVADALRLVGDAAAVPRTKLKGLELAFKEMAELGIDTTTEVHDFLVDRFGPDIASVFDRLAAAGIDTWEEIANASTDQIAFIFNTIKPLESAFASVFGTAKRAAENATKASKEFNRELSITGSRLEKIGRTNFVIGVNLNNNGVNDKTGDR